MSASHPLGFGRRDVEKLITCCDNDVVPQSRSFRSHFVLGILRGGALVPVAAGNDTPAQSACGTRLHLH